MLRSRSINPIDGKNRRPKLKSSSGRAFSFLLFSVTLSYEEWLNPSSSCCSAWQKKEGAAACSA